MTTHDALLAAILATPADDLPRLVYADWLEENGQPERAEFIRQSVADGDVGRYSASSLMVRDYRPYTDVPDWWPERVTLVICRGFISEIRCTLADWCGGPCLECRLPGRHCRLCYGTTRTAGVGPEVVRRHPVERVVLTDREPADRSDINGGFYWFKNETLTNPHQARSAFPEARLPADLFRLLRPARMNPDIIGMPFESLESALSALSAALIAWAKSQPHPARIVTSPVSVDFVTG